MTDTYFASCAGLQIVGGSLLIPLVGLWTADLELASDTAVSGQVSIVIGNLTLKGTVYRAEAYGGSVRVRVVAGYGGWRMPAPAQGYGSDTGVQLSHVLADVAGAVGEQVNVVADTSLGYAFTRLALDTSVASDVLWQLVAQKAIPAWYVDPDGVTQTGAWPSTTITTPFTVTAQRPDEGMVEIATEDYAPWLPGCTFANPLLSSAATWTSAGVEYRWGNGGTFRFRVLTAAQGASGATPAAPVDRVLGPLQQLIKKETASSKFFGRYEYTIVNPTPTTIDGSPCDTTLGLPDVQAVPITGDSIASYTSPDGGKAHIMFLDGSSSKPVCVWTEATASNGPTDITIAPQGSGANGVARVTDTVICLFPPIMPIAGTVGGLPFIGVLTITTPAIGAIQTGSQLVKAPS